MPRLDFYTKFQRFISVKLPKESLLIGRSSECDIQLPSEGVSRKHASIASDDQGHTWIKDLSTNGTRVNASMISGRQKLSAGDRIYVENYTLIYQPDDAPVEAIYDDSSTVHQNDTL